jgi:hypothetical protein
MNLSACNIIQFPSFSEISLLYLSPTLQLRYLCWVVVLAQISVVKLYCCPPASQKQDRQGDLARAGPLAWWEGCQGAPWRTTAAGVTVVREFGSGHWPRGFVTGSYSHYYGPCGSRIIPSYQPTLVDNPSTSECGHTQSRTRCYSFGAACS